MTFKVGDKVVALKTTSLLTGKKIQGATIHTISYSNEGVVQLDEDHQLYVEPKTTPHKWAKEIKAWADGAEIEYRYLNGGNPSPEKRWCPWMPLQGAATWQLNNAYQYRIKPEKKPDVVVATWIDLVVEGASMENDVQSVLDVFGRKENINCSFTFDGETGKLKAVALL